MIPTIKETSCPICGNLTYEKEVIGKYGNPERNALFFKLWISGMTFDEIAKHHKCSVQRVIRVMSHLWKERS